MVGFCHGGDLPESHDDYNDDDDNDDDDNDKDDNDGDDMITMMMITMMMKVLGFSTHQQPLASAQIGF